MSLYEIGSVGLCPSCWGVNDNEGGLLNLPSQLAIVREADTDHIP